MMLTRRQAIVTGLWIGIPFVLLLILMLYSPTYETYLFGQYKGISGLPILIVLQAINALILFLGFRAINRSAQGSGLTVLLSVVTFILLTLPAILVVWLYPAIVSLSQGPPL